MLIGVVMKLEFGSITNSENLKFYIRTPSRCTRVEGKFQELWYIDLEFLCGVSDFHIIL